MQHIGNLLRRVDVPVHIKESKVQKVYEAISKVMLSISKEGISKSRVNEGQGYKFRGIDDVYNAMAPILAEHKLCVLPKVTDRQVTERINKHGTALFYVTVHMDFTLVSGEDGSSHVISTIGEAMDSGDKATNKAMSAAYKYALMQAFCIPTEGDNDSENQTHEVQPKQNKQTSEKYINDVRNAKSMDDLKQLFTEGYKALKTNAEAIRELDIAKEARKKELTEINEPKQL
jgi:hypothetical protein